MRVLPLWTALSVLVIVVLNVPKLFEPSTRVLLEAIAALGPVSGWRCANWSTYVYDPRGESRDTTLLTDAPEDLVRAAQAGVTVERAEVSLRGSDAVLWTSVGGQKRVYVLTPGSLQGVGDKPICYAHQGAWRIVAEHALQ